MFFLLSLRFFLFLFSTNSSSSLTGDLDSPELPDFCTLGYKPTKAKCWSDPAAQIVEDPESSNLREEMATTPTFPEPRSQHLKQLVTAKKVGSFPASHLKYEPHKKIHWPERTCAHLS